MKNFIIKRVVSILLFVIMVITSFSIQSNNAYAVSGTVKKVFLKIGSKNVTKKTFKMKKGKSKRLKIVVKPVSSKKSVTYKSKNKKIVTVSKKGKLKAKKVGIAKIIVKVKGKKGKSKQTWMKVKVSKKKKVSTNDYDVNSNDSNIADTNTPDVPVISDSLDEVRNPEFEDNTTSCNVTFELNYDSEGVYKTVSVISGQKIVQPENPSRNGYIFDGWFTAAVDGQRFDFNTAITSNITLYAHWSISSSNSSGSFGSFWSGNGGSDNSVKPHKLSINISNADYDDESKKIVTTGTSINLSGTITATSTLKDVDAVYRSYGKKEKSNKVDGTTNWSTIIPLDIGTNNVIITASDITGYSVKKEVLVNRINEVIHYDDKVKLADSDDYKVLEQGMVACWIDDNGTLDDADDSIVMLVKDDSLLLSQIKQGLLKPNDVYMIPENDIFVTGFSGIYKQHQAPRGTEDYPLSKYPDETYEEIIFGYAGFSELFSEDVSLDFSQGINVDDPISFVMLPDGTCIDPVIETGVKFKKSSISTKDSSSDDSNNNSGNSNNDNDKNDSDDKDKDKDDKPLIGNELYPRAGWQPEELGKNALPTIRCNFDQYNRANIGLNWKDIVIYDHDGVKNNFDVKYGQIKLSGEIGLKNLTYTGGIEWHPNFSPWNFDLLPQQIISKLQYNYGGNIELKCDASVTTEELIKGLNNNFDNKAAFWGLELSGVNSLDSKWIIGAVGLNLIPPSTIVGNSISSLSVASKFTLSPSIILVFYMDLDGKISAEGTISFGYETSVEKGFNIQKNGYTGSYGSQAQNRSEQHFNIGNNYGLDVYNKDDGEFTLSFGGKVEATADIGPGVGAGLMIGGFCPAMMDAEVFYRASGLVEGEIDFLPEFKLNGYASLYQGFGSQADLSAKIKTNFYNLGFDINKHFEYMLWEKSWSTSYLTGTAYVSDEDNDNSNNEKIGDASVTLIKNDTGKVWKTTTDPNGKYEFNSIPDGEYTLKISKTGFNGYTNSKFIFSKHKEFDVFLDKQENLASCKLSGKITIDDGDTDTINNLPLENAEIVLVNNATKDKVTTKTSADGLYQFDNLLPGKYSITISKTGYVTISDTVFVTNNIENYYNTVIQLETSQDENSGIERGKPIAYFNSMEEAYISVLSDENGDYTRRIYQIENTKYGLYFYDAYKNKKADRFYLCDLNNDGIAELMAFYDFYTDRSHIYVYTYKSGMLVYAGFIQQRYYDPKFNKDTKILYITNPVRLTDSYYGYVFNGNVIEEKYVACESFDPFDGFSTYYVEKKEVQKNEYEKYINKYFSFINDDKYNLNLIDNTDANILKYIKGNGGGGGSSW